MTLAFLVVAALVIAPPPANAPPGSSTSTSSTATTTTTAPATPSNAPPAVTPPPATPPAVPPPTVPPQVALGQRAEGVRRNVGVIPTLVIVPDTASYVAAIGAWRMTTPPPPLPPALPPTAPSAPPPSPRLLGTYFPVLIDDGTPHAHEDIARFVRAFKPAHIVRWKQADAPSATATPGAPPAPSSIPARPPTRLEIDTAAARAWGAPDPPPNPPPDSSSPVPTPATPTTPDFSPAAAAISARWRSLNFAPPGVIIAAENDPAWTAALALSAGRGQPILWISPPTLGGRAPTRDIDERYTLEQIDTLSAVIEARCESLGFTWNSLGDQIDAVTLCLNTPAAANPPPGDNRELLASTDLVGRLRTEPRPRWAWSGQIFGTEAQAAYMSMCALFLQPRRAWLFDGYEHTGPFAAFDSTAAADVLKAASFECDLDDAPAHSDDTWRRRIAGATDRLRDAPVTNPGGIDAGLIAVNSSGYADFFDLSPGQCIATDVPILRVPAVVHFVHSWSAHQLGVRSTIAGRFISNGAFIYIGSVHEPYLSAFVATPLLMQRLLAMAPVAVAARLDDGPPWKVAFIGDPLFTLGPDAPRLDATRHDAPLPLAGAIDLSASLADALSRSDSDAAIILLTLLGRDADAARLAVARLAESPITISPTAAAAAAMAVFRSPWPAGQAPAPYPKHAAIARFITIAAPLIDSSPALRDALWHSAYPAFASLTDDVISTLRAHPRPEQLPRDAIDLAGAIRRASGADAAKAYLRSVRQTVTYDPWKKELDRAINK